MSPVLHLSAELIGSTLSDLGVSCRQSGHGPHFARFELEGSDHTVTVSYHADGDGDHVLSTRATTTRSWSADEWPLLLGQLNVWNAEHRWPSAHLEMAANEGRVVATVDVFLRSGLVKALLAEMLATATTTALGCHRWIESRLPGTTVTSDAAVSAVELESWLRRT
jgi:hypothetical protein